MQHGALFLCSFLAATSQFRDNGNSMRYSSSMVTQTSICRDNGNYMRNARCMVAQTSNKWIHQVYSPYNNQDIGCAFFMLSIYLLNFQISGVQLTNFPVSITTAFGTAGMSVVSHLQINRSNPPDAKVSPSGWNSVVNTSL